MKRRKKNYIKIEHPLVDRVAERVESVKPYAQDMKAYYTNMDYQKKSNIKKTFTTAIALIASYKLFKRLRHE